MNSGNSARQSGTITRDILVLLGIFGGMMLVSLPGYLRALPNVRAHDIHHELARLAQAKESWAVAHKKGMGEEVAGGIPMLGEGNYLQWIPETPQPGTWNLQPVLVTPTFEPEGVFEPTRPFQLFEPSTDFPESGEESADTSESQVSDASSESETPAAQ
jgi:hypothetical protein